MLLGNVHRRTRALLADKRETKATVVKLRRLTKRFTGATDVAFVSSGQAFHQFVFAARRESSTKDLGVVVLNKKWRG